MHAAKIAERKNCAEERKRKAFAWRFPAMIDRLKENGYRQAPLSDSQLTMAVVQKIRSEIDTNKETSLLHSFEESQDVASSCALLSSADPSHALGVFDKGLRSKNPTTRKACSEALADMFLCADDFSQRWMALFTLAKANDRYVPEATEELRELFGIDPLDQNTRVGNVFWKIKEVLSKPQIGASLGGIVIALLKTGYIRAGLSLFAAVIIAGTAQKAIERLSRNRIDTEHLLALACNVMDEEPEAI